MNTKPISLVWLAALATFALLLAGRAGAVDGHEQAETSATETVAAEVEVQMEAAATAESMAAPETKAETKAETAETETTVEKKTEASFEEKVTAYNKDKNDKEKVICRREKKTGSHFSRRRCVTAAQAKREREDAQEALQRASRGTNTGPIN